MKTMSRKIFDMLKGAWRFRRILSDNGVVSGVADFKETQPGIMRYKEEGHWAIQNQIFQISKEYQYRYDGEIDKITVYFLEQGQGDRIFHEIKLIPSDDKFSAVEGMGQHQCSADTYKVRYLFTNQNKFSLFYHVKGPNKDYVSETVFDRASEDAGKKDSQYLQI